MTKKSPENEIFVKRNNSCKSRSNATKVKLELYYVKTNLYMKFQLNMSNDDKEKSGKRIFLQRAITHVKVGQTQPKSNLICIMSRQIHIPNLKSIYQMTTEKSSENQVDGHRVDWLTDGQMDRRTDGQTDGQTDRRRGNLKSPGFTGSNDDWEKFGKPSGRTPSGLTDGRTDGQTDRRTDRLTDGEET